MPRRHSGFTLIELLIVVAIIAILAAIAVPNFLEAQTRAKVSRTISDFRSIKTGLESYAVDYNTYPETDYGVETFNSPGNGIWRLTTPIAYLTSYFMSPWREENIGHGTMFIQHAVKSNGYLYVRALAALDTGGNVFPPGEPVQGTPNTGRYLTTYMRDRTTYLLGMDLTPANQGFAQRGTFMLKSVGPDNEDNRSTTPALARVYDPTNGTTSAGDIVTFQDTNIQAGQTQ